MNIFVGNLSRDVSEEELRAAFSAFGQVSKVAILEDKFSGEPRGFGFIEMPAKAEAQAAINGMNQKELKGRALNVNEARPQTERPGAGGGRKRSGWGNRGGGRQRW
jgi:RNA recognition motif-containing protein